ncbi:MAG: hypothetical protein OXE99_09875 [Cellvibrionales bacterium]|nr:hypothetical protein [Cellvibrionales bacterium]
MRYHAHIYYALENKSDALEVHEQVQVQFPQLPVSHLVDYAVGPHLFPMFQVAFDDRHLDALKQLFIPYSDKLSTLIHPLIHDDLLAHTDEALWIGKRLPVNIEFLQSLT